MQLWIDIFGIVPVLGEPLELVNVIISLLRGNYLDAGLSALSMIPFADLFIKGGKNIAKAIANSDKIVAAVKAGSKYADEIGDAAKTIAKDLDEVFEQAAKNGDEVAKHSDDVTEQISKNGDEIAKNTGKYDDKGNYTGGRNQLELVQHCINNN